MIKEIKSAIKQNKVMNFLVGGLYRKVQSVLKIPKRVKLYKTTKAILNSVNCKNKIFYIGIPVHSNLGDLAQGVCIRHWLKNNYPDRQVIEIETNALVNTPFSLLNKLKEVYSENDFIIFQSGYTTTDLGGYADKMHRAVMEVLPDAKMLMMPQTIFYKNPKNKELTSKCCNQMKHLLFLARDRISYNTALEMFPDIPVLEYPDIVTSLIGNYSFNYNRDGIMFCCRNDTERFYSDDEIDRLMKRCSKFAVTEKTDTTKKGMTENIVLNAEALINKEIDTYAHYKLIITDRYHGTILALVAGTPVIIIKTTDHKVTTGAEWFKGVYDDYVYVANDLDEAYEIAAEVYKKDLSHRLEPYFKRKFYDKLPEIFEEKVG